MRNAWLVRIGVRVLGSSKGWDWVGLGLGDGLERVLVSVAVSRQHRADGLEKVLIGTRGPKEWIFRRVERASGEEHATASGANTLGPVSPVQLTRYEPEA